MNVGVVLLVYKSELLIQESVVRAKLHGTLVGADNGSFGRDIILVNENALPALSVHVIVNCVHIAFGDVQSNTTFQAQLIEIFDIAHQLLEVIQVIFHQVRFSEKLSTNQEYVVDLVSGVVQTNDGVQLGTTVSRVIDLVHQVD